MIVLRVPLNNEKISTLTTNTQHGGFKVFEVLALNIVFNTKRTGYGTNCAIILIDFKAAHKLVHFISQKGGLDIKLQHLGV